MKTPRTAIAQTELMRNVLAFSLVGAFVGALVRFSFSEVPPGSKEIVVYMVGQLSGMATTALGFYFVNKVGQDALDAKKAENTGKALEAIAATAKATVEPGEAAQETADAAQEQADQIKGKDKP